MRRGTVLVAAAVMLMTSTACVTRDGGDLGTGNGYVDQRTWRQQQDEYLRFATEALDPTSPPSVLAHLARAEADRRFRFDAAAIGPDDFAAVFAKIDAHQDTSDFDMMRLVALWHGHRRALRADLRTAIEQRFVGFRYWYTDPLPAGVTDNKWFWSENHRIIFHTLEYLAGRALPRATFAVSGEPGRVHADRGRERIEAWLDEKATWGSRSGTPTSTTPRTSRRSCCSPSTRPATWPGGRRRCSTCSSTTWRSTR